MALAKTSDRETRTILWVVFMVAIALAYEECDRVPAPAPALSGEAA